RMRVPAETERCRPAPTMPRVPTISGRIVCARGAGRADAAGAGAGDCAWSAGNMNRQARARGDFMATEWVGALGAPGVERRDKVSTPVSSTSEWRATERTGARYLRARASATAQAL